jgi:hypothetical protein
VRHAHHSTFNGAHGAPFGFTVKSGRINSQSTKRANNARQVAGYPAQAGIHLVIPAHAGIHLVIPAHAGIQEAQRFAINFLDSRLRGNDGELECT